MNKEQQLEEIEQVIYDYVDSKKTEGVHLFSSRVNKLVKPFTHNKGIAKALYNAGYRQIDENCAVITKAELKEYKRQAVKEFAERLKAKAYSVVGFNVHKKVYAKEYTINEIDINELLKEYEQ